MQKITEAMLRTKVGENYPDHEIIGIAQAYVADGHGWGDALAIREIDGAAGVAEIMTEGLASHPAIIGWNLRLRSVHGLIVEPDYYAHEWIGRAAVDELRH